jgi:hypothetical protein
MERTNRIFWKNEPMGFEKFEIRNLFMPVIFPMVPARRVGETVWISHYPLGDKGGVSGFVRAEIRDISTNDDQAFIAYDGLYGSGTATVTRGAKQEFIVYLQRGMTSGASHEERESLLERFAASWPLARIPITDYR